MSNKKVKRFKNSILSQDVLSAPKSASKSSSKSVKPKPQKKPQVSDVNVYELVFDKANVGNRKRNTSKSKTQSATANTKTKKEIKTKSIKATNSVSKPSVRKSTSSTSSTLQKKNPAAVIMAESLAKKPNKITTKKTSQLKTNKSEINKKTTKVSSKTTKTAAKTLAKTKTKTVKSSLVKKKSTSLKGSKNIKKAPVTPPASPFKLVEFKHEHLLDTSQAKLSNGSKRKKGSTKKELVTTVVTDKAKYNDLIEAYLDTSNTFVKNWFKLIKY